MFIRSTSARRSSAIWDAITSPEWNGKYGYQAVSEYDLKPGGKYRALANPQMRSYGLPEVMIDGEVIEVKPPVKLVQTYRWLFNDQHKAEGFTRLTFEIEPTGAGFCRLTVTHDVDRRADDGGGHAVQLQRAGRWRLELDPQRHEVAAGDRQDHERLIDRPWASRCRIIRRREVRVITLYTFGPFFGLPDPSPFVMKAEMLLKLAGPEIRDQHPRVPRCAQGQTTVHRRRRDAWSRIPR